MRLVIRLDGAGQLRWTIIRSQARPDVLARGVRAYADVDACYRDAASLLHVRGAAMMAVQQPDARWRWTISGPDGEPLAESAVAFDTAAACGYALHDLRHTLATSMHQNPGVPAATGARSRESRRSAPRNRTR